jgi:hypothetical protein
MDNIKVDQESISFIQKSKVWNKNSAMFVGIFPYACKYLSILASDML